MTQKDNETFREYAQRWRNIAAQVSPRVEEKEMTKLFLKTLSQFYYEMIVGSALKDFSEMVSIGMRLEEGVQEGRLIKGSVPVGNSKKKDHEVSMVKGQPRQQDPQQFNPQKHAPRTKFERNWVQIKASPPGNCQYGLELTSHVSFTRGHPVMMLRVVMLWRMQFKI